MMAQRWKDWCDRCNPVFVKEMREMTRIMVWWLFFPLLLIGLWLFVYKSNYGKDFFSFSIFVWMFFIGVLLCASAKKFSKERRIADSNFLRMATLSPRQIILGKFSAALLIGGLLWLVYPVLIVIVLITGHDGHPWRYMVGVWGRYGIFLLLLAMQSILLAVCSSRLVSLSLLLLIILFCVRLSSVFNQPISYVLLCGILLWLLFFWELLAEAALGDINTYRIAPLRKFLVVSAVFCFIICDVCARFGHSYRPQNYCFDYFCWMSDFALLLMWLCIAEPTLPGRRTLAAAAADSKFKYWRNRLLSESAVSGYLLGLLLLAVGVGGVCLTAGQVIWERNEVINGAALTIFWVGLLIAVKRRIEVVWNSHRLGLNAILLLGLFVSILTLSLPLCIPDGRLLFPLWDSDWETFHLGHLFSDELSPLFVVVMTLSGILFVLPSIIAYFRLKKE